MQEIRPAFHTFKDPLFSLFAQFHAKGTGFATKRTRVSDLWVFRPSHINVHGACGSVLTNAFTASTKSSSLCVEFKYGISIRPVATSKNPMRLVVPWRIYLNSILAHWPGNGSLSGYLCSSACTPVISSVETMCAPSRLCSWAPGTGRRFRLLSAQKIPGVPVFPKNEASNGFCGDVNLPHF